MTRGTEREEKKENGGKKGKLRLVVVNSTKPKAPKQSKRDAGAHRQTGGLRWSRRGRAGENAGEESGKEKAGEKPHRGTAG